MDTKCSADGAGLIERTSLPSTVSWTTCGRSFSTGRFTADSRLGEEAAAEALGVSRTPVRYALATLEQEGLVAAAAAARLSRALFHHR